MEIPSVSVGLRKGRIFVISTYAAGPGTYVQKEPVFECSQLELDQIGNNVLRGLDEFTDGGEMPDWEVYRSPVLEIAKVSNWREYERGLKSCVVERHEGNLLLRGRRPASTINQDAARAEIGRAVLTALGVKMGK